MDDRNIPPAPSSVEDLVRLSSSFDGFKRENAVRRLGMIGDPVAIPALIVRANDWVTQVRSAAHDALTRMLEPSNAAAFVASLPQLLHLQRCTRGDHSSLLQAVQEFLVRDGNVEALKAAWQSNDPHVARLVTRLLIAKRALPAAEIITTGLACDDVVIRAIVVTLIRELDSAEFEPAMAAALGDRYMPVRREAFQQLLRRFPERGLLVAKDFLFDSSAAVREIALRYLSAAGEPVEEMYSRALRDDARSTTVRCVLWAWGTMNCRSRLGEVERMLTSPLPSVRQAALQAFAKLSPVDAARHLEAALADWSASVAKEAARLIIKLGINIDVETLIAIARWSNEAHVITSCHRIARNGTKWDWLKFVLSVYPDPDSGVSPEVLHGEIHAWECRFNKSSAQPDGRTLSELGVLLGACKSQLAPKQAELLEFTLRTC